MKQYWTRFVTRIDALSLRERVIVFVMAVLVVVMSMNAILLDPLSEKYKLLSEQVKLDQIKASDIQQEIQQKVRAQSIDPDDGDRKRLQQLNLQAAQMQSALVDMQKGLVSPERMASLLEDILKRNGQLRLLALKTLPVTSLSESDAKAASANAVAANPGAASAVAAKMEELPAGTVYRHGVELTVQGGYLDMMHYMAALESMPWQVFWGKAKLNVDEYPKATLTLTLYTLSLDKKWLKL